MVFEYHLIAFVLLSICKYAFLNEKLKDSSNEQNMKMVKCSGETWPLNSDKCESSNVQLPYCYCDDLCQQYKDCCHDVNVSTQFEISRPNDGFDNLFRSMICIGNPNYQAGFWIVNSCRRTGRTYSFAPTLDPPVTDKNNVTYINADCARCNNVTVFKKWDILITQNLHSFRFTNLGTTFGEAVFEKNIREILPKIGDGNLIPPLDISIRICYGDIKHNQNCSTYQYPVVGDRYRLFKNEECCRSAGSEKCIPAWERKPVWCNRIKGVKFLNADKLNGASHINDNSKLEFVGENKGFAILLQFREYDEGDNFDEGCVTDEVEEEISGSENCRIYDADFLRQRILVSGYPMKYTLILVSYQPFDTGLSSLIFRAITTFLSEIKWEIGFRKIQRTDLKIIEGSNCVEPTGSCTVLYKESSMHSRKVLSVFETILLEAWMKDLRVDIDIKSPTASVHISGSFSNQSQIIPSCKCNRTSILHAIGLNVDELKLLPVASSKFSNSCEHFTLTVIDDGDREKLKISCRVNEMENNSVNKNKLYLFIYLFMLIVMLL